jgi:hypothetical protein
MFRAALSYLQKSNVRMRLAYAAPIRSSGKRCACSSSSTVFATPATLK